MTVVRIDLSGTVVIGEGNWPESRYSLLFARALTQYVGVGKYPALDIPGNRTLSLWVKHVSIPGSVYLLSDFDAAGGFSQGSLRSGSGASVYGYYQSHTDASNLGFDGAIPAVIGTWQHVAIVRDDTAKTVQLYVDGVADGATHSYAGKTVSPQSVCGQLTFARAGSFVGVNRYYDGKLDDIAIYPYALTAAQILRLAAGESPITVSTPAGLWHFDEGSYLIAHDATSNHSDGVLVDGPTWTTDVPAQLQ